MEETTTQITDTSSTLCCSDCGRPIPLGATATYIGGMPICPLCYHQKYSKPGLFSSDPATTVWARINGFVVSNNLFDKEYLIKDIIQKIEAEEAKLDVLDAEGHVWWNRFKDFINKI